MDWLQVIANIAQILGVIWVLFFGGKAVVDVVRGLSQQQPIRVTGTTITNVLLGLIFILLAFIASRFYPALGSSPTPIPTATPTGTPWSIPTLVQKNLQVQIQDTSSTTVTFPMSVTPGNLIIVAITQWRPAVSSVNDNRNNTYIQVITAQHANASTDYIQLYYAKNITGGATTITVTFSKSGGNVGIYEYSGLDTTSPLDQVTSNVGLGDTPDGGALNTTKDNELYFAIGVDDNGNNSAPSAGSGYTLEDHEDDSTHHERFYSEDRISAHGSYQTNFSIAAKSDWAVIGASFKPVRILTSASPAFSSGVVDQEENPHDLNFWGNSQKTLQAKTPLEAILPKQNCMMHCIFSVHLHFSPQQAILISTVNVCPNI